MHVFLLAPAYKTLDISDLKDALSSNIYTAKIKTRLLVLMDENESVVIKSLSIQPVNYFFEVCLGQKRACSIKNVK